MPSSPTVAMWDLGQKLREKRDLVGLSGADVGKAAGIATQFLSAVEHGKKKLPEDKFAALVLIYEIDRDEANELQTLREQANQRGWWTEYSALFSDELLRLFGFEHGAESLRTWDNGIVNGLLQTEGYAQAIIAGGSPNVRLAEVDRRVRARLRRQRRLVGDEPLELTAIMSESTIRQQVGGPAVLAGQLRHLLDMIDKHPDTLDIRVVPFTATGHEAMGGASFYLMTFPTSQLPTVVWQETVSSTDLIFHDQTVREYSLAYTEASKVTLSRQQTVDLINQVAKDLP